MKKTTSVVELKARLSEHLRLVKAGHELVITERGVPVARVVPLDEGQRRSTRRLRLTRGGLMKPGRGKLPALLKKAPSGLASGVLAALLAERGDRSTER
jgi:prevent-host-death family protein